jgi:hypothetical protein
MSDGKTDGHCLGNYGHVHDITSYERLLLLMMMMMMMMMTAKFTRAKMAENVNTAFINRCMQVPCLQ